MFKLKFPGLRAKPRESNENESNVNSRETPVIDTEKFTKVYKLFLETLIHIFYPVHLQWYEFVSMIILGALCGIGIGYTIGLIIKAGL